MRALLVLLAVAVLGATSMSGSAATVTVKPGETLSHIAVRHAVSQATLARANGISDPDRVRAGDVLSLPASGGASSAPPRPGAVTLHRVRLGDTLSGIAARHRTSVGAIAAANGIRSPGAIVAGQLLHIPGAGAAPRQTPSAAFHRVRRGETLDRIARRHGVSVAALASANGIGNVNRVRSGRVLRIPAAGGAPTRPASPSPSPSAGTVRRRLDAASARHGVEPALARAIAWQESGFNQRAVSSVGAVGVMQLMPGTARWVGSALLGRPVDRRNVRDNVDAGVAYLAWLQRTTGSRRAAIGSYYQGPGSYRRDGAFDDTKRYIASVTSLVGRA